MSLDKKLNLIATAAASEAMQRERGRVLWLMDVIEQELERDFDGKLLVEHQRQLALVKLQIAKGIFSQMRVRIASGVRKCERCDRPVINRALCEECLREDRKENGQEPAIVG